MSVDTFISAVKDKRNEAIEIVLASMVDLGKNNEDLKAPLAALADTAYTAIDKAVAGTLDVVEEQYESLVIASAIDSEGEEVDVSLGITADLSTLFFEEISN